MNSRHFKDDLPWKKATKPLLHIRSSRHYFVCRGPCTSLILKESPVGVTQTRQGFVQISKSVQKYNTAHKNKA